jgi:hypothetical protein
MQHHETFLQAMYAPAMLYAPPEWLPDKENLALVQTSMLTTALQKMGVKTTLTAICHGTLELGTGGGLNILLDLQTHGNWVSAP